MVAQESTHGTGAGIFGTESNYGVTRHTGYGSRTATIIILPMEVLLILEDGRVELI